MSGGSAGTCDSWTRVSANRIYSGGTVGVFVPELSERAAIRRVWVIVSKTAHGGDRPRIPRHELGLFREP